MTEAIQRIEIMFQNPVIGIPLAIASTFVSVVSRLEWATDMVSFMGACAGFFVSLMLIIINWKKMAKAVRGWLKK